METTDIDGRNRDCAAYSRSGAAREAEIALLGSIPLEKLGELGWQYDEAGVSYIIVLEYELAGRLRIAFTESRGLAGTDACRVYHSFTWTCMFQTTKQAFARGETEHFIPTLDALADARVLRKYQISKLEDRLRALALPVLPHSFSKFASNAATTNLMVKRRALAEYYVDMVPAAYRVYCGELTGAFREKTPAQ